jgi:transposase
MGKSSGSVRSASGAVVQASVSCGIDVSAASLAVAVAKDGRDGFEEREFPNTEPGHRQLIAWLGRHKAPVRVSMEATGIYSLDVALALDAAEGIEVAVLNPRRALQFARSVGRSKTDKADARALALFCRKMDFEPWRAPSKAALALRSLSRLIGTLVEDQARLNNRLHAAKSSATSPPCVLQELKRMLAAAGKRIARLRRLAVRTIGEDKELERKFRKLISIPGIAETSAAQLLGELAALDQNLTARQLVALAGLDPVHQVSGSSVRKPSHISRQGNANLRRGLFLPAMVAARHDPHLKAFYQLLLTRHKAKLQALIAVARKILHAIHGIFKTDTPYDGEKLFPHLIPKS